jgi:hypothetical protein
VGNPSNTPKANSSVFSAGIARVAREYCRVNQPEFSNDSQSFVADFLLFRYWLSLGPILVGGLANGLIAGWISGLFLLPSVFLVLAPPLFLRKKAGTPTWLRIAPRYFDAVLGVTAVGFSTLWVYIYQNQLLPHGDAPVQLTLGVLSMLPFHSRFRDILIRNLALTAIFASVLAFYRTDLPLALAHQFVGGLGVGTCIAFLLYDSQKIRFYTAAIHRKLTSHFTLELERLVYDHQIQLLTSHRRIEETMRLDEKEGFLGEFDIVNSSVLQNQPGYHEMKNSVFSSCYQRLLQNYRTNPEQPHIPFSDGHIVKEMGDGFIFSVGYPFDPPPGRKSAAEISLDLATSFWESFTLLAEQWEPEKTSACAVILIRTPLQGFWTSYKVKRYDFRQSCMTKVARVGELRRILQHKGLIKADASYLILDPATAQALPESYRRRLEKIALSTHGLQVRGYPEMEALYVAPFKARAGARRKKAA